jgi:hemerythrin
MDPVARSALEAPMPIQWTTDLVLGVPDLDAQHLELDRQLAIVHDALCAGAVPDLAAVLDGVRACSARHFEAEEAFMERCRYPTLDEHRARHREFTAQLARLEEARAREGETTRLAIDVGNWLAGWVREHQRYDLPVVAHARAGRDGGGKAAP